MDDDPRPAVVPGPWEADGLAVRIDRHGDVPVLVASGEVDMVTADLLERAITSLASESAEVLIDLRHVTFFSARGISALLIGARATESGGGSLRVTAASMPVRRVLEVTEMAATFRLAPPGLSAADPRP